jgi:hypothetical protein
MEAEGLYGDMRATPAEMAPRLRRWVHHAEHPAGQGTVKPEVAAELRRLLQEAEADPHQDRKRPWLCKNWTVICPLEAGLAPLEQAGRSLERVEGPEFTGRWGMYLSGSDRTRIMSINTGVLAVAELAYGRVEKALDYVRTIAGTLAVHMPGAISEMLPDEGCFVAARSGYGVAWPLVTQVFGVQPDAFRRRLMLTPHFPANWPGAGLSGVRIGSNIFDVAWDGGLLTVTSREPGWTVTATGVSIQVETIR